MKNILYFLAVGLFIFSSCADEELSPVITYEKAEKGAYPRLVELIQGEYDLADIPGSAFSYEVEFVDEQQGDLVGQYDIYVRYTDNDASNGDNSKAQKLYASFSSSEFNDNDRGFKGLDISLPFTDVAAALGVDVNTISPGDVFNFATEVIKTDGAKFTAANSSSAVRGSAFQGFFNFNANATCPISNDLFVGSYALTYDDVSGGWGESITEGTVTLGLVQGSTTRRQFSAIFLPTIAPTDATFVLEWVCDIVKLVNYDSGLSCGGPSIQAVNTFDGVEFTQPADILDDSVIIVSYVEDGGACGYAAGRTMRLTKQ